MRAPLNAGVATSEARNGAFMAVAAMCSVQLGAAIAVGLIDDIGATGVAWLRLFWAAVLLLIIVRPRPSSFTRKSRSTRTRRGSRSRSWKVASLPTGLVPSRLSPTAA